MRFNFKADGTTIKRCDKCGREVCRLIPTGNPSTPIREEVSIPYTTEAVKRLLKSPTPGVLNTMSWKICTTASTANRIMN